MCVYEGAMQHRPHDIYELHDLSICSGRFFDRTVSHEVNDVAIGGDLGLKFLVKHLTTAS